MTGDASLLRGKTVLITGASKGLGAAIAQAYAQEGATLLLVGRSRQSMEEVCQACWGLGAALVDTLECDLLSTHQIDQLAAAVVEKYAGVDVLVNNAGGYPDNVSLLEGNVDEWMRMLWLNLDAPMRLTRQLAPAMVQKGGGAIINLSSVAALKGVPDEAAYCTSKAGMRGWSLACYQALKGQNIKVCCILPSHVETRMALKQEGTRTDKMFPENMIRPEDVAEAALLPFRLSDQAVPAEIILHHPKSAMA